MRSLESAARKQGRVGMGFVQPLADGERLRENDAIIRLEGGDEALWIDAEIARPAVLAFAQVKGLVIVIDTLECQRDADAM